MSIPNDIIRIHDKEFVPYIEKEKIEKRITELAQKINLDYRDKCPIILSILNGSFIFTADLVRQLTFPVIIEFVRYSSYQGISSAGSVERIIGIKSDIKGKDLIIVEDIIDTGLTISEAIKDLEKLKPKSVRVVSLLLKPAAIKHEVPCEYCGFEIPNDFVLGYGLDYNELGRQLPAIYRING